MEKEQNSWIIHGVSPDDPRRIKTIQHLADYIEKIGFLPLFKNDLPMFSVEEMTVSEHWWSGDCNIDPWMWREQIAAAGNIAYGKFFGKKAGFLSLKWLPYFANFRRDGYDFDALWEDGKAPYRLKMIMDIFDTAPQMISNQLKDAAGFGKGGEKNFEGTITALQMQIYLCVKCFRKRINRNGEPYGWPIAVYTTPEALWGYDVVTAAYHEEPADSHDRIRRHITDCFPHATERQIASLGL